MLSAAGAFLLLMSSCLVSDAAVDAVTDSGAVEGVVAVAGAGTAVVAGPGAVEGADAGSE